MCLQAASPAVGPSRLGRRANEPSRPHLCTCTTSRRRVQSQGRHGLCSGAVGVGRRPLGPSSPRRVSDGRCHYVRGRGVKWLPLITQWPSCRSYYRLLSCGWRYGRIVDCRCTPLRLGSSDLAVPPPRLMVTVEGGGSARATTAPHGDGGGRRVGPCHHRASR